MLLSEFHEPLTDEQLRTYSPLTLAYLGDCVYEMLVRAHLVCQGNKPVNILHADAKEFVSAERQSLFLELLLPALTDEEQEVYKRGRNAKPHTTRKSTSLMDYKRATGFEALFGYLYLKGDYVRVSDLFSRILAFLEGEKES